MQSSLLYSKFTWLWDNKITIHKSLSFYLVDKVILKDSGQTWVFLFMFIDSSPLIKILAKILSNFDNAKLRTSIAISQKESIERKIYTFYKGIRGCA